MWEELYKIQASIEFKEMWAKFLNQTGNVAHPIFYQYVTNKIRYGTTH